MQNQLTCEQVEALLNFYIENKLSEKLSEYVRKHIEKCPSCMDKYIKMRNMLNKIINIECPEIENPYITKQYEDFKSNLSAYIDNELDDLENIKIKKISISNPLARQDLEKIYTFKKLLNNSYEKTKSEFKNDLSKNIIHQLQQENYEQDRIDPFTKLVITFFAMLTCIVAGIIGILYF